MAIRHFPILRFHRSQLTGGLLLPLCQTHKLKTKSPQALHWYSSILLFNGDNPHLHNLHIFQRVKNDSLHSSRLV
jgi:hypothetical protein